MDLNNLPINQIICGDSEKVLSEFPDNCVDLIASDPPYGINFKGFAWDQILPKKSIFHQAFRILKPGGMMMIMSGARLDCLSRMVFMLEETGLSVKYSPFYWAYQTGMAKGTNIDKSIDKKMGLSNIRGWVDPTGNCHKGTGVSVKFTGRQLSDTPISEASKVLYGHYAGVQTRPAVEVIIIGMKPLVEKTYTDQAIKWYNLRKEILDSIENELNRIYGINVDKWIENIEEKLNEYEIYFMNKKLKILGNGNNFIIPEISEYIQISPACTNLKDNRIPQDWFGDPKKDNKEDFYPSNLLSCDNSLGEFNRPFSLDAWYEKKISCLPKNIQETIPFLFVPKPSPQEKQENCENLESVQKMEYVLTYHNGKKRNENKTVKNDHPTVKSIKLFTYLVNLASFKNDIVLDMFNGSGTTCIAAKLLNRRYIGIDFTQRYCDIANSRLSAIKSPQSLF